MLNYVAVHRVFHALGDPTRRAILERLSLGPAPASSLAEPMEVSLAAIVQHLQVLEESGLVRTVKTGRVRACYLKLEGIRVAEQWLVERRTHWEEQLERAESSPKERERPTESPAGAAPRRQRRKAP